MNAMTSPTTPLFAWSCRTLALVAVLGTYACDKKPEPTVDPDTATDTAADEPPAVAIDASVPQEPDPAELGQGAQLYLMGQYGDAIALLQPIYADLKTREQYRASALAAAWLALSHAKEVFENGKEPAEWAVSMAASTKDPEVAAAAGLAMGAYLIGNEEYDAALTSLEPAAAAKDPRTAALGHQLRAEAFIGAAFGGGHSESVQHPEKFEQAKDEYEAAGAAAKGDTLADLLTGRIEEGYAALSDYRKDKAGVCPHAIASLQAYARAGATRLLEGPAAQARASKCELPPELRGTGES